MKLPYIGKHRPKTIRDRNLAIDLCCVRDAQARLGNYPYMPRHNATVRGGAA